MQITLKQEHIEAAVRAYVAKAGIAFPVEDIDFTAGRGKSGLTATIEVQDPFAGPSVPQMAEGEGSSEDQEAAPEAKPAKTEKVEKAVKPKAEPKPLSKVETLPAAEEAPEQPAEDITPEDAAPPFDGGQEAQEAIEPPKQEKASLFS